ncbi:unnamed protein product (macronuclear) [Paramecium tetraurelia]|uniref:Uncharacterized protein n=1 Tax=Paramecium tetraurelia TaxID=5888 RepID=A0CHR7_PARTE|nr:uncharacterized protein GSPATT00038436001 [Paramecium tetraurelia]CAK70334.1 unnamed protein product [Paramecium tetraurelia]|eukprot:XP_001437731.1 hypothetical protein (macronuclear) [Paramecium tetraurelia strain d4-2]
MHRAPISIIMQTHNIIPYYTSQAGQADQQELSQEDKKKNKKTTIYLHLRTSETN